MRTWSKLVIVGVACVAAAVGLGETADASYSAASRYLLADPPAPDNGGSIVEDGSYPGAADIEAQQNIKLISGDGHIVLADCATAPVDNVGVINVWTTAQVGPGGGRVCFKVTASTGLLNLQVPGVFEIDGDGRKSGAGHQVTAVVTTDDGVRTSVAVKPFGSTQVGIGAGEDNDPTTLLQLKVTG
jgi:hypothetical protein